jgi:4-hydroxybenzoate polyprenyltransferase/phosphoserine phosphatase
VTILANASHLPAHTQSPVLCVDLDGSLLATDMLWESVLLAVKSRPSLLLIFPFWLLRGKAYLKRKIAERVKVNAAALPYRSDVLSFLVREKKAGRKIVLTTASDMRLVQPIAQHIGVFDDVIASDGELNLKGTVKQKILEDRYGSKQFDYLGDSAADLAVWESANAALLVEPSKGTLKRAMRVATVERVFHSKVSRLLAVVKALRCNQWSKNLLIFVPLLTSHEIFELGFILKALTAFVAMSFCASSIYIINDFLDVEADRQHPKKKFRPVAAGTLSIPTGAGLAAVMCLGGLVLGWQMLPLRFTGLLLVYLTLTVSYSILLKRKMVADVITLALLYTLRILIGGAAVGVAISAWLLAFSMFLFLSLAFVKRYGEIGVIHRRSDEEVPGRAYIADDKAWMSNMGGTSGYLGILVFALYINSNEVAALYRHPEVLWFACPPLLYWINRTWLLASRGKIDDDPLVFAATDRVSYAVALLVAIAIVAAL